MFLPSTRILKPTSSPLILRGNSFPSKLSTFQKPSICVSRIRPQNEKIIFHNFSHHAPTPRFASNPSAEKEKKNHSTRNHYSTSLSLPFAKKWKPSKIDSQAKFFSNFSHAESSSTLSKAATNEGPEPSSKSDSSSIEKQKQQFDQDKQSSSDSSASIRPNWFNFSRILLITLMTFLLIALWSLLRIDMRYRSYLPSSKLIFR